MQNYKAQNVPRMGSNERKHAIRPCEWMRNGLQTFWDQHTPHGCDSASRADAMRLEGTFRLHLPTLKDGHLPRVLEALKPVMKGTVVGYYDYL